MEFELKTGPQGHVYFCKKIREVLGEKMTMVPNASAAVVFKTGTTPEDVIRSIAIIAQDLKHHAHMQTE